ncbi:hypothetical protein B0H12DRAFT_1133768 [Mycena haematopus]|nr:hypothetical protein B0H12DRAFT_1133768 [Mycena haematopus]
MCASYDLSSFHFLAQASTSWATWRHRPASAKIVCSAASRCLSRPPSPTWFPPPTNAAHERNISNEIVRKSDIQRMHLTTHARHCTDVLRHTILCPTLHYVCARAHPRNDAHLAFVASSHASIVFEETPIPRATSSVHSTCSSYSAVPDCAPPRFASFRASNYYLRHSTPLSLPAVHHQHDRGFHRLGRLLCLLPRGGHLLPSQSHACPDASPACRRFPLQTHPLHGQRQAPTLSLNLFASRICIWIVAGSPFASPAGPLPLRKARRYSRAWCSKPAHAFHRSSIHSNANATLRSCLRLRLFSPRTLWSSLAESLVRLPQRVSGRACWENDSTYRSPLL